MSKGVESNPKRLSLQSSGGNIVQILSPGQQQTPQSQQAQTAVVVNSAGRPATLTIQRATTGGNSATSNAANKTSDLIDLTDEEDKTKGELAVFLLFLVANEVNFNAWEVLE